MAWRRPGDKPLSETMMVRLLTHICVTRPQWVKRTKTGQFLTHLPLDKVAAAFADDIFKRIFLNENIRIPIRLSLKLAPWCPIDNIPALREIMARHRIGTKPLSGPMLTWLTDAKCGTRGRWVKSCLLSMMILKQALCLNMHWKWLQNVTHHCSGLYLIYHSYRHRQVWRLNSCENPVEYFNTLLRACGSTDIDKS